MHYVSNCKHGKEVVIEECIPSPNDAPRVLCMFMCLIYANCKMGNFLPQRCW